MCLPAKFTPWKVNTRIEKPELSFPAESSIRRPSIKFGAEQAGGCVNGESTQHLLHHGLQRLKEKSLYLPLCFIKGHPGSADLCVASMNFHSCI